MSLSRIWNDKGGIQCGKIKGLEYVVLVSWFCGYVRFRPLMMYTYNKAENANAR